MNPHEKMDSDMRMNIGSIYGVEAWERLTGILWNGDTGYDLWKFERDVEYKDKNYRCVIIEQNWYDENGELESGNDVFSDAWEI